VEIRVNVSILCWPIWFYCNNIVFYKNEVFFIVFMQGILIVVYQLVAIVVFCTVGAKGHHGGGWVNYQGYCHGIFVSTRVKIAYVALERIFELWYFQHVGIGNLGLR
jgi:hypothetical protein